jgi:hypothetical protein
MKGGANWEATIALTSARLSGELLKAQKKIKFRKAYPMIIASDTIDNHALRAKKNGGPICGASVFGEYESYCFMQPTE